MKKLLYPGVIFIIIFYLSSCSSGPPAAKNKTDHESNLAEGLGSDEGMVFALPSPFQISAILKIMNIGYEASIIESTNIKSKYYANTNMKAMNLGINMVDLGYLVLYEEYAPAAFYIAEIENMLDELGYGLLKDAEIITRFENSYFSADSVRAITEDLMYKVQDYISQSEEKKIPVLALCGLYVESLYISVNIYSKALNSKLMTRSLKNSFNKLLIQQRIYISNLLIILESFEDEGLNFAIDKFIILEKVFEEMQFEYNLNSDSGQITSVKLKTSYIPRIRQIVGQIRSEIINDEFNPK